VKFSLWSALLGITPATHEVIGAIADIEMQRQAREKDADLAAFRGSALSRLHEVLDREKEALQLSGPEAARNVC